MEIMQIYFAVAKFGQRCGLFHLDGFSFMTGEAEFEFVPAVAVDIESTGIFRPEYPVKIAAVRIMAA
jgi:hypothetical protein